MECTLAGEQNFGDQTSSQSPSAMESEITYLPAWNLITREFPETSLRIRSSPKFSTSDWAINSTTTEGVSANLRQP